MDLEMFFHSETIKTKETSDKCDRILLLRISGEREKKTFCFRHLIHKLSMDGKMHEKRS